MVLSLIIVGLVQIFKRRELGKMMQNKKYNMDEFRLV